MKSSHIKVMGVPRARPIGVVPDPLNPGCSVFTLPRCYVSIGVLARAREAVYAEFGRGPDYYLVGWAALLELLSDDGDNWRERLVSDLEVREGYLPLFMGRPLISDPRSPHYVMAVPPMEYLIGRKLPPGARWEPEVRIDVGMTLMEDGR